MHCVEKNKMGASCSATAPVSSTIKKNWRDHPPSSYSLKIHNFSQFEKPSLIINTNLVFSLLVDITGIDCIFHGLALIIIPYIANVIYNFL